VQVLDQILYFTFSLDVTTVLFCSALLLIRNFEAKICKKQLPNGITVSKIVAEESHDADESRKIVSLILLNIINMQVHTVCVRAIFSK